MTLLVDNAAWKCAKLTTRRSRRTAKGDLLGYNYNCWLLYCSLLGQGFETHTTRPDEEDYRIRDLFRLFSP